MAGNVQVTIRSRSVYDGGEDWLHYDGSGQLKATPAGWLLACHSRCREDGGELHSRVRLAREPRRAILWRLGPEGYALPLEPGQLTRVHLPSGLELEAQTQQVDFALDGPEQGWVRLDYTLLVRERPMSRIRLEINIRKD